MEEAKRRWATSRVRVRRRQSSPVHRLPPFTTPTRSPMATMEAPPAFAQVGGHASTIKLSDDTSIVNKPLSVNEHLFYTTLGPSLHEDFVGTWTPAFYGTLTLQGKITADGAVEAVPQEKEVSEAS